MTKGVLGIIACPMVDDNLVYSLHKDPEPKDIAIISNKNNGSLKRKLEKFGIEYREIMFNDLFSGHYSPSPDMFNLLIYMTDLGLHARPDELKSKVEELATQFQPFVDGIGFYLGTCGNYEWNIPKWCEEKGYKPSATFTDSNGRLCHDCVGINIAGGPRYKELQEKYTGHLYVFPAMATNYDEFMDADSADKRGAEASLTPDMREILGIGQGPDAYMQWLLKQGGYEYILKLDTGIGNEDFDKNLEHVAKKTDLKIKVAEEGWATLQPTDDLYARCKSFLAQ